MGNHNTIDKSDYVWLNILFSACALIWYHNLLFRNLNGMSYAASRNILWSLVIFLGALGMGLTWKSRRNYWSLIANILLPIEIYTFLCRHNEMTLSVWIAVDAGAILSAAYIAFTLTRQDRCPSYKGQIMQRKIIRAFFGSRMILASCLSVFILSLCFDMVFSGLFCITPAATKISESKEEVTIANNIETVSQLREDIWGNLSDQERLDVLQVIADIEAYYLGLPHPLNIRVDALSETTAACYQDSTYTITINIKSFEHDNPQKVLDSVCHEARHAYQHRLCEVFESADEEYKGLLIFRDVKQYCEEFSDYADGKENLEDYYCQECEVDARIYARESVADYYKKIKSHTEKETS